jgi:hypothetical protein
MVVLADRPSAEDAKSDHFSVAQVISALTVGLVLVVLGWWLPSPGGSVIVPTLIVFGAGAVLTIVGVLALPLVRVNRPVPTWFLGLSSVLVLAVTAWTLYFSMATQLVLSNADEQATKALAALGVGPGDNCKEILEGGVGPQSAPYQQCATSSPQGTFVIFSTSGRGLGYTNVGARSFPDECVRHITGEWWMFTQASDDDGNPGSCPVGYVFDGGP